MKIILKLALLSLVVFACQTKSDVLYQSDQFTLFKDGVTQGANRASVNPDKSLTSNYQSLAHENYSRLITFKFSINEKDNENPSGLDHRIVIKNEHESPVLKFGEKPVLEPGESIGMLPPNYEYTFRVDMNPVLKQFEQQGFYEAFDGSRIAREDFKGVYIAGGAYPLSWDFSNLDENGLRLKDDDGDGVFELKLTLNPYDGHTQKEKTWKSMVDVSDKPVYHSDQPIVDALFNMSLEEARLNIEADSTLRTGAKWGGVWTRDVSYSILLAFAYHEPEVARISLMKKVKNDRIIQDTGSGGAWPVSSDRTTWALGAWEVYKVTGDEDWLKTAYAIIKNTLDDDFKVLWNKETGMFRGESSFLDWREQTYPKWMDNKDIYVSECLGTNVVHYRAHQILIEMSKILQEPYAVYQKRAESIKKGINDNLWMSDKGYYGQYLYGRSSLILSPRYEALGEALAILFDVADQDKSESIVSKSPLTAFGATCIYPQIPGIPPYHNNGIWPFVQSYWNLAAAKTANEAVLNHGLASLYRAGALFLTNYENFVAGNGDYFGTEINSHRMLWSMAGNLAMVHRVFMGINFKTDGLHFQPVIPKAYGGVRKLSNFRYRQAVLDITVEGHGNRIREFIVDGKRFERPHISSDIKGRHSVIIRMADNSFKQRGINLVENSFSLSNTTATITDSTLKWKPVTGAKEYKVYQNGNFIHSTSATQYSINPDDVAEYAVTVVDATGQESFCSEPILVNSGELLLEAEDTYQKSTLPYINYRGSGFIKTSTTSHTNMEFVVESERAGEYLLDCRYANGTGPWNTDNNCCIRTLTVNGKVNGTLVMPQRGKDEWSDWGYSNGIKVILNKGKNKLQIDLKDWNVNMDGDINEALIDQIRLVRL